MSSDLSDNAIHRILAYFKEDGATRKIGEVDDDPKHPRRANQKWNKVFLVEEMSKQPIPEGYLRSVQFAMYLKDDLDDAAMRILFDYGKPFVFDRHIPSGIVSKIIKIFQRMSEAPLIFDVTLDEHPYRTISTISYLILDYVWPEVYDVHLPCAACTCTIVEQAQFVVEKFHFPSKHFNMRLTVELRFDLDDNRKYDLKKIILRVEEHLTCSRPSNPTTRTSRSLLLLPEFAAEVYGFLDRADVGTSLLASGALKELIQKLRHRLPVHHLRLQLCEFWDEKGNDGYWLTIRHIRTEPLYTDKRRLIFYKAAIDCTLSLRYLSNSHVADFAAIGCDDCFPLKTIAALLDRNFSVGCLGLTGLKSHINDYRSMDVIFGGELHLTKLNLHISEEVLGHLVKTMDFWRQPTMQSLTELRLRLERPSRLVSRRQRAVAGSLLWITGIHMLRKCAFLQVDYETLRTPDRHLESIAVKLVQLCEKFERGEISNIPECFTFSAFRRVTFPFSEGNMDTSLDPSGNIRPFKLYRFRNAVTGEFLSVCVSKMTHRRSAIHMYKRYRLPDNPT